MSSSNKNIEVIIPEAIQIKLNNGDYLINGTQVRDRKGRIVCNLSSLATDDKKYFSPHIFQHFENCTFISNTIIPFKLQKLLRDYQSSLSELNAKIDVVLARQTNDLVSAISEFDEHFNSLMEGSTLTTEKQTFQSGVKAASLLASHLNSYLNSFIDDTKVFHCDALNGEKYADYKKRKNKLLRISKREFSIFSEHHANHFSYSFLNIINNLNILSFAYNGKTHPRYIENLNAIEAQLRTVLDFLIQAIDGDTDIYQMCYTSRKKHDDYYYYPLQIERVIAHDSNNNINNLINRSFTLNDYLEYDFNRVQSIYDIIDLLEEINALKARASQIAELDISELNEISLIKKLFFKPA